MIDGEASKATGPSTEVAGTLHDFNNALQAISASLRRLGTRIARGDNDVSALLASMQQQVMEVAELGGSLSRTLTLAPGVDGSARQQVPVAVGPFLSAMAPQIEALLPADVRLELMVDTDAGVLACVPAQLLSVIRNLVLNARDAMDGVGQLQVRARRVRLGPNGQEPFAEITIRDTGRGMAPDVLRRCLEPFMTTKGATGGSGLGLYQVRVFADGMGGSVRLQSREGDGTTVLLLLPDGGPAEP